MIGITRVRNESLIIADTIAHFLSYCEHIILYDDCSTDDTVGIARAVGGTGITVIHNDHWRTNRMMENTRHRAILLEAAKLRGAEWCLCFDADERLVGTIPPLSETSYDGYQFRLFDGYLTQERQEPFVCIHLEDLPRMWGPEYRDILMLFRTNIAAYLGTGRREPMILAGADIAGVGRLPNPNAPTKRRKRMSELIAERNS